MIPTSIANGTKDQGVFFKREGEAALTDVLKDVDDKEWRDQVVDALHIAAGRVADGPDKQDPLKYLTQTNTHTKAECQNSEKDDIKNNTQKGRQLTIK